MANWGASSATHGSASITNSASGTVIAASTTAHYRRIQNVGAAIVYLNFGAAAIAETGVALAPFGSAESTIEMSEAHGNVYRGVINGIAAAGTVKIITTEW